MPERQQSTSTRCGRVGKPCSLDLLDTEPQGARERRHRRLGGLRRSTTTIRLADFLGRDEAQRRRRRLAGQSEGESADPQGAEVDVTT